MFSKLCDGVLLCSLQANETNVSGSAAAAAAASDDVAYHVTETEFLSCRPTTSLVNSTVPAFTVYDRLQTASNYFIGERCSFFLITRYATVPLICSSRLVT